MTVLIVDGIEISGFSDEIAPELDEQLAVVTRLGMRYISLRAADGKNIAQYTPEEAERTLRPRLEKAGVRVSSLGSPIGKVRLDDEEGYSLQIRQLESLCAVCRLLNCRYIRVFSFYIPEGRDPDSCKEEVLEKMRCFVEIAQRNEVILIHENEKEIFGDIARRERALLDEIHSPWLCCAFDFANFVQCGEDPRACWDILHDQVAYIHIKDALRDTGDIAVCGRGDGQIAPLLRRAIREDGYRGFLTLEPHLVLFDSLQGLETKDARAIIGENQARDGADGYRMQFEALCAILREI